jgi:prepilin-type N-terminal cleavage/methylation domain-containing protein
MMRGKGSVNSDRAFTLIELLVVVSIIALLVAILLPSLSRARKQAQMVVCVTNMKQVATGIQTYVADNNGNLPGPLHPAMYRSLQEYPEGFWRERMLTWKLRNEFKDAGGGFKDSMTEKVATCPVLLQIVPDKHFIDFQNQTGKGVKPTHYVINSYGPGGIYDGSLTGGILGTKPPYYFGSSYPSAADSERIKDKPPQQLGAIKHASAEWAVAEAWYRPRGTTISERLQQEGPYQSEWSGQAFPNFAPHMRKGKRSYTFVDKAQHTNSCTRIDREESDGMTSTAFFDGHAAPVKSKPVKVGNTQVFYGFPGTRNWDDQGQPLPPVIQLPPM